MSTRLIVFVIVRGQTPVANHAGADKTVPSSELRDSWIGRDDQLRLRQYHRNEAALPQPEPRKTKQPSRPAREVEDPSESIARLDDSARPSGGRRASRSKITSGAGIVPAPHRALCPGD